MAIAENGSSGPNLISRLIFHIIFPLQGSRRTSALSRRNLGVGMNERHGSSRRWHPEPAASTVPLTIRIFWQDNALG